MFERVYPHVPTREEVAAERVRVRNIARAWQARATEETPPVAVYQGRRGLVKATLRQLLEAGDTVSEALRRSGSSLWLATVLKRLRRRFRPKGD